MFKCFYEYYSLSMGLARILCYDQVLRKLCDWSEKWQMKFNIEKCKVMHLLHKNKKEEYEMYGETMGPGEYRLPQRKACATHGPPCPGLNRVTQRAI
jgi:hypothetical protein